MSRTSTAHADQWLSEETGVFRRSLEATALDDPDHVFYEMREAYLAKARHLRYEMRPLPANRVTRWERVMRERHRSAWLSQLGRDLTLGILFYLSIFIWFSYAKPGTYEAKAFSMGIATAESVVARVGTLLKPRHDQFEVIYGK
jgi:hypothetical protein